MKKNLFTLILFFALCGMIFFNNEILNGDSLFKNEKNDQSGIEKFNDDTLKTESSVNNIQENNFERSEFESTTNYKINAALNSEENILSVEQLIIWEDNSKFPTNEIYFSLNANSLANDKTGFLKESGIKLNPENRSKFLIKEFFIEGKTSELIYENGKNKFDSTIAKIILPVEMQKENHIEIKIKYDLKIPRSTKLFGYSANKDFYFFDEWFPKVCFYANGKWINQNFNSSGNSFSNFANYSVNLSVPEKFKIAATGNLLSKKVKQGRVIYTFNENKISNFTWLASENLIEHSFNYKNKNSAGVKINIFILPDREKYFERYRSALINGLNYFENNIGKFPYKTLTLSDLPKTNNVSLKAISNLITVNAELFSPIETHNPEKTILNNLAKIYFGSVIKINPFLDGWLSEGISSFVAEKILIENYGNSFLDFKLFGHYPIFGLNLISYNEIPLVYSLEKYKIPEGAKMLQPYYKDPAISISESLDDFHESEIYFIQSSAKPQLMLHSLERYLGKDIFIKILKNYFDDFKFENPGANDFWNIAEKTSGQNLDWFIINFYESAFTFDYKIEHVKNVNIDEYEVSVKRSGAGFFKNEIVFYTDKDTLKQFWNDDENRKKFYFKTKNIALGAEVDPFRKNLLDVNFANNSYIIDKHYGGSLSFSARWFFWIQNLFLIMGSIA